MEIDVGNKRMVTRVLFTQDEIKARVAEMTGDLNRDFGESETLVILVVLHGALLFAADLVRGLRMPTEIESVRLQSYHGTESTGVVRLVGSLPENLAGRNVLVVEDIVDSGRTLSFLLQRLRDAGVRSVRIATLLDKPEAHATDLKPDYVGFSIGRHFVIGYGLDLDGKYRNLPHVAELVPKNAHSLEIP